MKSFFIALSLIIATAATASEIKLYEVRKDGDVVKAKFAINKELGRAWLEVSQDDYSSEGTPSAHKVKVPGLSFDAATSTILLNLDGQLVECANLVTSGRSIFRITRIINNRCSLSHKYVVVTVDDGFNTRRETRLQVFLSVD